jgi:hypothetical protein
MFLRRYQRRKNGKPHSYWALVESYRTAKGSRQRVVAYLGELAAEEQDGWSKLGSHLEGKSPPRCLQRSLFDPPRRDAPQEDEPLLVKLSSIRLERTRDFGDVWLAWGLWRMPGLDEFFAGRIERGREDVSWGTMAAILTIARFCEPAPANCISPTAGIVARPWRSSSASRRKRSTPTGFTRRSINSCRTRTPWKGTFAIAWVNCSS